MCSFESYETEAPLFVPLAGKKTLLTSPPPLEDFPHVLGGEAASGVRVNKAFGFAATVVARSHNKVDT